MYALIILALLERQPLHGYLISKITNDILGPYAKLSNGRLYPLLAQLTESGLISVVEDMRQSENGRRLRQYAITDAGRERLREMLMDTTSNLGDYMRVFWYKAASLYLLSQDEQLHVVDHFINYCQTHIFHYIAEIEDMPEHKRHFSQRPSESYENTIFVMEHILRRWRLELESAQQLRARILTRADGANNLADGAAEGAATPRSDTHKARGEQAR